MSVLFVSMTLRIAMSLSTGAEMVVMSRRMEARRRNVVPTLEHSVRFMYVLEGGRGLTSGGERCETSCR